MHAATGLETLAQGAVLSPFTRINRLLAGIEPGHQHVIEMTAGDPKEVMPGFVPDKLIEAKQLLSTYPKIRGSDDLRGAIAAWLGRRYGIADRIDPAREIHPLNGSREGLFFAALPAVGRKAFEGRPLMLLPNPFYQAYLGATLGTNCEPYYLNATAATGNLPDLNALEREPETLRPGQSARGRRRSRLFAQGAGAGPRV